MERQTALSLANGLLAAAAGATALWHGGLIAAVLLFCAAASVAISTVAFWFGIVATPQRRVYCGAGVLLTAGFGIFGAAQISGGARDGWSTPLVVSFILCWSAAGVIMLGRRINRGG